MELGNLAFGHARGRYLVPRDNNWEGALARLFTAYADNNRYAPAEFENETFAVAPYWWGGCTCGAIGDEHAIDCKLIVPNFIYKPTGFEIRWYKYPLRDSYMNKRIRLERFRDMIDACVESV